MSDEDSVSAKSAKSELEEEEYVVEAVVNKRIYKGVLQYLLKWKGYSSTENTWEPEENCGCPELIAEFERNEKNKKGRGRGAAPKAGTSSGGEPSTSSGKGANKRKRTDDSDVDEPITVSDSESNATNNSNSPKKARITRGGAKKAPAKKGARALRDSDSDYEADKKSEASSDSFKPAKKTAKKVSRADDSDEEYKHSDSDKETRKEASKKKVNNNNSSKEREPAVTVKERPKRRVATPDDASDGANENKDEGLAGDNPKEAGGDSFKTDEGHLEPEKIIGATSQDGQVMYLIKWKNMNKADLISSKIAKIACPQIVLAFLEERLKWDDLSSPSKTAQEV